MKFQIKSKKRMVAYGILMCVLAIGIVTASVTNKQDMQKTDIANTNLVANDDISNTDDNDNNNDNMYEHDGDILVDSLSIASIPDNNMIKNQDTEKNDSLSTGTVMVTSDEASDLEDSETYFSEARATVNMDRNQIISMLTDVIAETESETEKENAAQQKLKLIDYMEKEKVIESLLGTKGFTESFVLITDNAVNVTVYCQNLTQADVAKIYDIVMRETERPAEQIVIQSKY